jgi:hypothetical protein
MADKGRSLSASPAIAGAAGQEDRVQRKGWLAALLWMIFASGLVVQALAPRLKIEHHAFVVPPSMVSAGKPVDLAQLVAREKRMQLISGLLTLGGALGLGYYYRDKLLRRRSA